MKSYYVIPVLLYIPKTNEPLDELLEINSLRDASPHARIFLAEDFDNGVAVVTEDDELSAHITHACPRTRTVVNVATPKSYTVVAVSSNANSFGYKSVLCLAEDGEGFHFLVQAYGTDKVPARGDVVRKDESRWYGAPHPLKRVPEEEAKKILADVRESVVDKQASDAAFGTHGQG